MIRAVSSPGFLLAAVLALAVNLAALVNAIALHFAG